MHPAASRRRRLLAPEVVQTSTMDCGPASLKCLLEGFYIPVSYGRLREACQTDVDGTSIDALEEIAGQLGLQAEQVMLPVDHVLLPRSQTLPALAIVRLPHGDTHFVVLWRRHGGWVQVMDPATGRRWSRVSQVLDELYIHSLPVAAEAWLAWAASESFLLPLRHRMANVGVTSKTVERLVHAALSPAQWRPLAALDAAVRMVDALVSCGGLRRGRQAEGALLALLERARNAADATTCIPDPYWSVRPAPESLEGDAQVMLRGAVAIQVEGPCVTEPSMSEAEETASSEAALTPELAAALAEPPSRPAHTLWQMLRQDGLLSPTLLTLALALGAGGVLVEALLFRGLIDLSRDLSLSGQRLGAMGLILALIMLLLVLDLAVASGVLRGGQRLEVRLRTAFLAKLPRLADRYFHSRPLSDMAERSHSVHRIRQLLSLGGQGLQLTFELVLTTAAIVWLAPASAPFAILAAMLAIGIPLAAQPALAERDLRVRTHNGALSRFDLDALRGLVAIRTHGADRAVEHAHRHLLGEWACASLGVYRVVVTVEGLQFLTGFGLAVALLTQQVLRGDGHGVLLLVYWALNLPVIGQDLALLARQYPTQRSITLRLLEPLGALEDKEGHAADVDALAAGAQPPASRQGVAIALEHVQVRLAGHLVLEKIDLNIPAGQHVAIVGASGAGKSSLVGTLLGWHRPAEGHVLIDGQVLDSQGLEQLRRQTAWVDPAVQLWNRSLLDNLHYGTAQTPSRPLPEVIEQAALRQVLEKLPDGLQSALGESGSRLSGGEGQRVRFGRALLRPKTRLVILDEAFRGLDRGRRRDLLSRARHVWADATLLCITHDVGETQGFGRVLVIDQGHVVEDGAPHDLLRQPESRYRELIEAEAAVRTGMWSGPRWRHLALQGGQVHDTSREGEPL